MDQAIMGPIGGPELIIIAILLIFGLWWLLSFLPGKAAVAASSLLVAFSINPAPVIKAPQPTEAADSKELFL